MIPSSITQRLSPDLSTSSEITQDFHDKAEQLLGVFLSFLMPKESPLMEGGGLFDQGIGETTMRTTLNDWAGQELAKTDSFKPLVEQLTHSMNKKRGESHEFKTVV